MPASLEAKSLSIRLKPALYDAATRCAKLKGSSLNSLVQQGLENIIRAQEEQEMHDAATLLVWILRGVTWNMHLPLRQRLP